MSSSGSFYLFEFGVEWISWFASPSSDSISCADESFWISCDEFEVPGVVEPVTIVPAIVRGICLVSVVEKCSKSAWHKERKKERKMLKIINELLKFKEDVQSFKKIKIKIKK